MKVSIIIPNYNGSKYLVECLKTVYKQSYLDYEVIVVDNNSSDNSISIVQENFKNINCIILQENYGFSKAVNMGIKAAKGEFVVLLNNDTQVEFDWLENILNCIQHNNKIFSVSSKMIQSNKRENVDDAGDIYTIFGWAFKRGMNKNTFKYNKLKKVFSSCAGAAIYRKSIFDEIGYFDENYFAYMEDVDICYRSKIFGYINLFCPNAVVYHIGSATSGSKYNEFKIKLASRNSIYVPYKNMPLLQLIINMPFLILGYFIKYIFFLKRGYGAKYIEGLKEGLKNLKTINKVEYKNTNFFHYIKIECELLLNVIRIFINN